jgi:hypothetical protein
LTILDENRVYNCHHIIIDFFRVEDSVRLGYDALSQGNKTSRRLSMKALICFESQELITHIPEELSPLTPLYGSQNVLRCAN